ncbi:MAG: O-antigen ligase family protein [Devosiaceae bacterium]|nr:O-antigen ligase family protein [Devosiaceae bacterium]
MSDFSFNSRYGIQSNDIGKKISIAAQPVLHFFVAIWVFGSSFVLFEPSPYELLFFLVLPLAVIARVGIHIENFGIFLIFALFTPFALIAVFQVNLASQTEGLIYTLVTLFLFFTSYFVANYVADAPYENMRNIMRAWMLTAIFASLVGTLAYLSLIPGEELFTRYGRAKGFFKDPNVFGPFLILPAMYALQKILLGKLNKAFWPAIFILILSIGIFVSFSRAAWGAFLLASILVFGFCFWFEANARTKIKMMVLGIVGALAAIIVLLGLISIPSVGKLFSERNQVVQEYDGGDAGRFGRQKFAFELAINNPLGIGPLEFRNTKIGEEPHNTYVNIFHVYGWGGGLLFIILILLTLKKGLKSVAKRSKNRLLMIPLISTFIPLIIEAAIIDIDHWRLFYFMLGLIWGVSASYDRVSKKQMGKEPAYI